MKIDFGGEQIEVVTLTNGDKVLIFKEHKILFSDIEEWLNSPFGVGTLTDKISISKRGGIVSVGCLEDTETNFLTLFKQIKTKS